MRLTPDSSVREGLKLLHSWPTFPQLVVDGAFVGGLDVVTAMRVRKGGVGGGVGGICDSTPASLMQCRMMAARAPSAASSACLLQQ